MRDHRRCASWMVMLGWLLGCGWQAMPAVAAEAESDGSFLLYAPSGTEQRLLVVRARPAPRVGTGDGTTGDKNTKTSSYRDRSAAQKSCRCTLRLPSRAARARQSR